MCRMDQSLFLVLVILQISTEYDLRCPGPSEWKHQALANCINSTNYICLFNEYYLVYSESCHQEYLSGWGMKRVRSPGINEVDCSPLRYQPFIFTTNGNSDCVYGKSLCTEEGQVVANNGTTTEDIGCRCDYTKGYTYTSTPENVCSCIPSKEDCSCYMKQCPDDEKLNADYMCMEKPAQYSSSCPSIRIVPDNEKRKMPPTDLITGNMTKSKTFASYCTVIIVIALIYIVLQLVLFVSVRPYIIGAEVLYMKDLILKTSDEPLTYTVWPGYDLTIEWKVKSLFNVKSVICEKDKEETKVANGMKYTDEFTTFSLTVNKFKLEDAGTYTCKVTNVLHLTNTYGDGCLNFLPCKQSILWCRKSMQYFPMLRSDVVKQIQLRVCCMPTHYKDVIVVLGQMAKLEIIITQNIYVKWFKYDNCTFVPVQSTSEKYSGGTLYEPYLHIKSAVLEDAGQYVCLMKDANNDLLTFGYKLIVMPQEKIYKDVLCHKTDLLFVKTSTVNKAFQCLHDHGILVLTGREGTGKSKMCLELASMCENIDYLPYEIDWLKDNQIECRGTKLLYIIDNVRFDRQTTDQLRKILPSILSSENKWIVITCRTSELVTSFKDALNEIGKFKEECLVNLDKSLTEEEKKNIIGVYLKYNNIVETSHQESNYYKAEIVSDETIQVKIDKEIVRKIIKTDPFVGFPMTTVRFCRERQHLCFGEKYFTDPPKKLVDEIKDMYRIAKDEKTKKMINRYTVLVYLTKCDDLELSSMDTNRYKNILSFLNKELDVTCSEIAEAANSMIGKYLSFEEGRYLFIHPYMSKAVLLSSYYCVESFLIQDGPLNEIMKFIRSSLYKPVGDELVCRLNHKGTYKSLFDRLFGDACKEIVPAMEIYSYMYNHFIKLRDDTFVQVVFETVSDKYYNVSADGGTRIEVAADMLQQICTLLHGLTDREKDSYIYSYESMPDIFVPFGLIAACKQGYSHDDSHKGTFTFLLQKFQRSWQQNVHIDSSIDINGNTFFHYVTLYNEYESCCILDTKNLLPKDQCSKVGKLKGLLSIDNYDRFGKTESLLSKDTRDIFGKANKIGVTPLEIAAFLGKVDVCKRFLVKTKHTNKKKKHLCNLVKNGMSYFYGTASSFAEFDITVNFEDEVRRGFKCGSKDDYFTLQNLFNQEHLDKTGIAKTIDIVLKTPN